jgi:phosphonate transport system substrate-binding protein
MRQATSSISTIHFATFLSPVLYKTYKYIADYVGKQIGCSTTLKTGQSLAEFADDGADIGFLCGLQYVHMKNLPACPVELLVAPVLQGQRYQHRPIYYSDVIVRRESSYASFDDLNGCIWAYNERVSHSGYNLVCYSLLERNKTPHYFGKTVATGSHLQSLQAILDGKADGAPIDSHLLDVLRQEKPEIAARIRVIDSLGPSTIPPLVISTRLDEYMKQRIQMVLLSMHEDPSAAKELHKGQIECFAPVRDEDYDDIRAMVALVQKTI